MLTEVEEDDSVWAESTDEKEAAVGNTDPHNVAINAINCISNDFNCFELLRRYFSNCFFEQLIKISF
jgi:hypothetical protein